MADTWTAVFFPCSWLGLLAFDVGLVWSLVAAIPIFVLVRNARRRLVAADGRSSRDRGTIRARSPGA